MHITVSEDITLSEDDYGSFNSWSSEDDNPVCIFFQMFSEDGALILIYMLHYPQNMRIRALTIAQEKLRMELTYRHPDH